MRASHADTLQIGGQMTFQEWSLAAFQTMKDINEGSVKYVVDTPDGLEQSLNDNAVMFSRLTEIHMTAQRYVIEAVQAIKDANPGMKPFDVQKAKSVTPEFMFSEIVESNISSLRTIMDAHTSVLSYMKQELAKQIR